jgi:hypothetical protein
MTNDSKKDLLRVELAARREVEFLTQYRAASLDQAVSIISWLIASMLAINGAGVLAVSGAGRLESGGTWAAVLYVLGVLAALACGYFVQQANVQLAQPIGDLISYFSLVAEEPSVETDHGKETKGHARIIAKAAWPRRAALAISLLAFLAGSVVFTASSRPSHAETRRCSDVQNRMLVDRHGHDTWTQVFQALGCHPQGEGSVYAPPLLTQKEVSK